ncbi:MAG TPA: hypothetical protein VD788_00305 [Candidatus Polarisedimenticolaceae bacterium]|nr:hypothetical protein [Candidatus Polarisedimenticolaceae bacterium]
MILYWSRGAAAARRFDRCTRLQQRPPAVTVVARGVRWPPVDGSPGWAARALLGGAGPACLAIGLLAAVRSSWVTDDAFISFRYAENLVGGLGLVFNAGERVEGYTNFLWTMWCAAGLGLGIDPVPWALASGVACYGASIVLLVVHHLRLRAALGSTGLTLPVAAVVAALHRDWAVWATGGLETAAFTLLALIGFLLLVGRDGPTTGCALAAGAVLALAAMTRPDGVIFAAVAGPWLLFFAGSTARSRWREAAAFVVGFAVLFLPFLSWRLAYYGELVPNTYHAKSAALAWYGQGWHYLRLFFTKYWVLALAAPLAAVSALRLRAKPVWFAQAALAAACALAYTFWVWRVGGGFMFARLLVPTLPFWAILLDLALLPLASRRAWQPAATSAVALALLFTPQPIEGRRIVHGIADEPRHYARDAVAEVDRRAAILRRYFAGLDVTVGFTGSEARLVYRAAVPRAIECEAGLTDPVIARRPLERRGRPGHEKHATLSYLVDVRRTHFVLNRHAWRIIGAENRVPPVPVEMDGVRAWLLHWDPRLVAELRGRGARVPDFPAALDRIIAGLDRLEPLAVEALYRDLCRFYFDHVDDPARRQAFTRHLRS